MSQTWTLASLVAVSTLVAVSGTGDQRHPVVHERFHGPSLEAAWTIDASPGNSVAVGDGFLEIAAAENTFAHIERPLDRDHIRATCTLQSGSGISWATSLFLFWGPGNWCQIGVIPRGDGRFYACVTTAGQRDEYDLSRCRFADWHPVGIELGKDCIRFLTDPDARGWRTEHYLSRPDQLMGAPKLLIVGKGYGLDESSGTLNADYADRGQPAVSRIRDVQVRPTPADRMRISAEEAATRARALADPLGQAILELPGDPSFEAVAGRLPALARPREVVGVKDHPYEIGVEYDGTIQLADDTDLWEQTGATAWFELGALPVRFGAGGCRKELLGGYVPVVTSTWDHDGLQYRETVFGWSEGMRPDAPLWAFVRLEVCNRGPKEVTLPVVLRFKPEGKDSEALSHELQIPGDGTATVHYRISSPVTHGSATEVEPGDYDRRLEEVTRCWTRLLNKGLTVNTPEPRVNDAYRAWLAYNFLNVDKRGNRYEPRDGAGFYEKVFGYSAALYCHALDLWGFHEDAARYLESMLGMLREDGLFYVNYGLPDHGALMLALCEHLRLTGDRDWATFVAPSLVRMGDWTLAARKKALAEEREPLTRGLIRFAPYADYPSPTFSYYGDVYCCAGLEAAAQALGQVGLFAESRRFADAAAAYRRDIVASMEAAAFEHDSMRLLPLEPDTRRHLVGNRYHTGGYYGLVSGMLLETEWPTPDDPSAMLLVRGLEKRGGLILGMCEFDGGVDHAYTYGYWLNCLRRDDVERVLLGFYGTLAYGMGRDTYCGVEVTQIMTGEPTPTTPHLYSGTQQLRLLRNMLVQEEGDELVIGRGIAKHWLVPGKTIDVRNAPTYFGPVSFIIEAADEGEKTRVRIEPPKRTPPRTIRLALRHLDGARPTGVRVNGEAVDVDGTGPLRMPCLPEQMEVEILHAVHRAGTTGQ